MHLKMAAGRGLGSGLIESTARQKREGARGAVCGWFGLGLDALQSVEVSMKSISKHLQQGKEKQCDSYVALQSARQPLKSPPHVATWTWPTMKPHV